MNKFVDNLPRDILFDRIKRLEDAIRAEGATELYVYGSRARGDNCSNSDLDIYIDFLPGTGFSLMEMAGIRTLIEQETGLDVHITTKGSLHPELKADIESQAVQIL